MLKFAPIVFANLRRRRLRTAFTLASIMIAFLMFGLLEAMGNAFSSGADVAGQDRLLTMHKVSFVQPLPESYRNRIRTVDGVRAVSATTWLGGVFRDESTPMPVFPVDDSYLDIYPELQLPAGARERWLSDRRGALVGRVLANEYGWKAGDVIPMRSVIWRKKDGGDTWELNVTAVFDLPDNKGDTRNILMRQEYFGESLGRGKGLVGWYVVQVRDPKRGTQVAREIDALFANSPYETKTSAEKALVQSFIAQIGNIGAILTGVVSAVFFTMLLVTANTMAQSVRERTGELAVLKTLGFTAGAVTWLVLAEAVVLTLTGGLTGLGLAWVVIEVAGPSIRQFLPVFLMPGTTVGWAVALMLAFGVAAGALPAYAASRLRIVDALRRA